MLFFPAVQHAGEGKRPPLRKARRSPAQAKVSNKDMRPFPKIVEENLLKKLSSSYLSAK